MIATYLSYNSTCHYQTDVSNLTILILLIRRDFDRYRTFKTYHTIRAEINFQGHHYFSGEFAREFNFQSHQQTHHQKINFDEGYLSIRNGPSWHHFQVMKSLF